MAVLFQCVLLARAGGVPAALSDVRLLQVPNIRGASERSERWHPGRI